MTIKHKLLACIIMSAAIASIIFSGSRSAQSKAMIEPVPEVTISFPVDGSTIKPAEFTAIRGTVDGRGSRVLRVKVSLGKHESDEEWARPAPGRPFRWVTGPTGQWLPTVLSGSNWSAPNTAYRLPRDTNLPDGAYVIYAIADAQQSEPSKQARVVFKVSRQ